jgi:hypothetical protein
VKLRWPTYLRPGKTRAAEHGYLLILVLVESFVVLTIMGGVLQLGLYNLESAKRSTQLYSAQYAAEAGGDRFMYEINNNTNYAGTNTVCPLSSSGSNPVTLYSDATGRATYETCVTAGTITNEKIVYSIGKVYVPASSTTPKSTRELKLVIEGTPISGYALQTGPGGLIMSNTAAILNGPIYVGGYLTMSNLSQIGTILTPTTVNVANQRCPSPADSTFPSLCASGVLPNPITINNLAHIYGTVNANGQTSSTGMSNPGLTATSGVAAVSLPDYDRTSQKAAVTTTTTGASASCGLLQTRNFAANTKITGNLTISNTCIATVSGNLWITGNLTLSNTSILKVADGISTPPVIMVDGSSGISMKNLSIIASNLSGVGFEFITYYSTAPCSPDCSTVTGSDLYNSMNIDTITIGNQGLGAGNTFYARWSGVNLQQSGTVGSLLGQRITLGNSGNLTLGTGAGSPIGYSWNVRYYNPL